MSNHLYSELVRSDNTCSLQPLSLPAANPAYPLTCSNPLKVKITASSQCFHSSSGDKHIILSLDVLFFRVGEPTRVTGNKPHGQDADKTLENFFHLSLLGSAATRLAGKSFCKCSFIAGKNHRKWWIWKIAKGIINPILYNPHLL